MIVALIQWSIRQRFLVLLASAMLVVGGLYAIKHTPVDAIPDLSDVQVIIKTRYPGQAPQLVEDQVTYPLSTAMLAVPGAKTVRGFSFFGDSYIYVIFDEKTDMYWARSRVLEYLSQIAPDLPEGARAQLGPDATGVGWIYLYALIDRTGKHDISQLRSLQDYFLKYELQTLPGVSEVASIGGLKKQYQVLIDPEKLRAFNIPLAHIQTAVQRANQESGASVIEIAEAEYMLRVSGYLKGIEDLSQVPLGLNDQGSPLLLKHVADVQLAPQMRRGIAELNGEGEVTGAVVVMRYGENAQETIDTVKIKLDELRKNLPEGVEIVPVYDRSDLIQRAVKNLWQKLAEELALVAVVCALFLFHLRSSLVALISLPIGILIAFMLMKFQGLNANIMSLGGIAIAIGAMIDGAIVMIENLHKHMEKQQSEAGGEIDHWKVVSDSATEVGPALFFSLLIITVSFLPVFTLEAQEGKLFSPLAYTKTWAMAAAAFIAITLIPVLMGYFIRGKIVKEEENPLNRLLLAVYRPVMSALLRYPWVTLLVTLLVSSSALYPLTKIGSEFMPDLDEGDLMYMPSTYPGVSIGKARELLQQTDKLIATVPEVKNVFGKIGRAETATDPAPLTMIETFIQLKPRKEWRAGMTTKKLIKEFEAMVNLPGMNNAWVMPIKTRIDMLATGIKTPLGLKLSGPDLQEIQRLGLELEVLLKEVPGTASVYAERAVSGRYIKIDLDREKIARYGLNIQDVQQIIRTAVGGVSLTETVEGLERYPVSLRYPQAYRDSPEALADLPLVTATGQRVSLGSLAKIYIEEGPAMIKSENARPNSWVLIDLDGVDPGRYVKNAEKVLDAQFSLPRGYSLSWSGQYEYMQRAKEKLNFVVPLTLAIIFILLYLNFSSVKPVLMILLSLPFSLVGSVWLMYFMDFNFSIAVGVGFIALAGVAAETAVIMLMYLERAQAGSVQDFAAQIVEGASRRVRPVLMTASATVIGLVPILLGTQTGSEVMSRLAAPMVGGMLTTILLTLFILPLLYYLIFRKNHSSPV